MDIGQISKFKYVTGYLGGVVNSVFYGLGSASAQGLLGQVPDCQLSVYRYIGHLLVFLPLAKATGTSLVVERQNVPYVLYSAFLAMVFSIGLFGSTGHLPLIEAVSLTCVATIFATAIHRRITFKKDLTFLHLVSFLLCSVGIMLVSQPPWLFGNRKNEGNISFSVSHIGNITHNGYLQYPFKEHGDITMIKIPEHTNQLMVYVLLVLAGIGDGMNFNVNAEYLIDVPSIVTAVYGSVFGLICSLLLSLYLENIVVHLTMKQALLVLGHVACSSPVFFTTVYTSNAIGGMLASLVFSLQILVMLILQYTLMSSIMPGHHNWLETFGAIVLLFAITLQPTLDVVRSYFKADILP